MAHNQKNASGSALRVLTLVSLISAAFNASAQNTSSVSDEQKTLAPVVVTASRFPSDPAFAPIGATVITAEEIRETGASDINEAIRNIAGIPARQNLAGMRDHSLDIRGFGETSNLNLVVLVDGVRIDDNDLSAPAYSSIPVDAVERIEIVRGGSSVLYGEGATGGTIHIITKRGAANVFRGSVAAEIGSFDHREIRASLAKGWDQLSITANASKAQADNYRDNQATKQENFNGAIQWANAEGRIGLRADIARHDGRLPGPLTPEEAQQNPRRTKTPDDFGARDVDRYTVFAERRIGNTELAAELARTEKSTRGFFAGEDWSFDTRAKGETTQFSPRVRHLTDIAGGRNELVAGVDISRWTRHVDNVYMHDVFGTFPSDSDSHQKSRAIYIRDEVRVGNTRIAAGVRREEFDQRSFSAGAEQYDESRSLSAWELQGSYDLTAHANLFVKTGKSYRIATADENNTGFLEPQTSRDFEAGATLGSPQHKVTIRAFQHQLKNEIAYDPTVGLFGANSNLDPTRRRGVELEVRTRIAAPLVLSANLQHISAKFTEGAHAGENVPLVPNNTASMRVNWQPAGNHSAYAGVRWVDSQFYGGDFDNKCSARIPSHATLDARYAVRAGTWEFAVTGSNLTDKNYFTNGFASQSCGLAAYPENGRQLKFMVRKDF